MRVEGVDVYVGWMNGPCVRNGETIDSREKVLISLYLIQKRRNQRDFPRRGSFRSFRNNTDVLLVQYLCAD